MDNVGLIKAVLNLTSLCLCNSLCNVRRYGASLRAWHQAARAKHFTETTDQAHHIGRSNRHVKIHPAFALNLGNQFLRADKLRACLLRCFCIVALSEHSNTHGFTRSVGQYDRAANLLIRMAGVNAQANVGFHSFIKFSCCGFHRDLQRFRRVIELCFIDKLGAFDIFFTMFHSSDLPKEWLIGLFLPPGSINRRQQCPCCAQCRQSCWLPLLRSLHSDQASSARRFF